MTFRKYLVDSSLTGNATITVIGEDGSRPFVCLDQTLFHVQGGGQPADRGRINGHVVSQTTCNEIGLVRHYLETLDGLNAGQTISMIIEGRWRDECSRLHSGGHLIASVAEALHPNMKAISGHHFPNEARVEFIGKHNPAGLPTDFLEKLNFELKSLISAGAPVTVNLDSAGVRVVQVGTFDPTPCGGTHVDNLQALSGLAATKLKTKSGRIRISYSFR